MEKNITPAFEPSLNTQGIRFNIYGRKNIEESALHQMYQAARLPVSVAGALMPDAHHGYGLPIGGVLATRNAVIPYGVGVDIGCRMALSVYDIKAVELNQKTGFFERILEENTLFGSSKQFDRSPDHEVMDNRLFFEIPLLKQLHTRAWKQLGSSGSGNHFVEFGIVRIAESDSTIGIPAGEWLGLLSHSGSRALGAKIAQHYTQVAISARRLQNEVKHLSWLNLEEEAGAEYWACMNLAGNYSAACHELIHKKISKALGRKPVGTVQNHHNFAWKEKILGEELIVHRKGATPAGENVPGIIPGSMTAPGYIVKGKGIAASLQSASHGAGRKMSRRAANESITKSAMKQQLKQAGVTLMGGGVDEAPQAYKDLEEVMASQTDLVTILGSFHPRIVRMDGH